MVKEQKKLEELIYLSLIGKFFYMNQIGCNTYICFRCNTYICFTSQDDKANNKKPFYITSENVLGDKVSLAKLNSFEKHIYGEELTKKMKDENLFSSKEKLNYSKRIKFFIDNVYLKNENSKKIITDFFDMNILLLRGEQVIDDMQYKSAIKYVHGEFNKANKNQNLITK